MARLVVRPLMQLPVLHHHCYSRAALDYYLSPALASIFLKNKTTSHFPGFYTPLPSHHFQRQRNFHRPSRGGLNFQHALSPSDLHQGESSGSSSSESESDVNKSRNQKKREARRAVRWGMKLASFSLPQIKRILRVALLEREVFDALMLVKKMGPDVREGKRRQYNYIGKLLREVEPGLMDALIHATKDGDWSRLQAFSGLETVHNVGDLDDDDDNDQYEGPDDEDEEGPEGYINIATRWFDGLINKDIEVTNEVYAVRAINFDRQELRKLVRTVHAMQERKVAAEENNQEVDTKESIAKKSLTCFLRALARQISTEPNYADM